jgi:hypothetical protein
MSIMISESFDVYHPVLPHLRSPHQVQITQRLALTRNIRPTLGAALISPRGWFTVLNLSQRPDTAVLPLVKKVA